MSESRKKLVLFPGTFDPITKGHLDVIQRGANLFDQVVVGVGENPEKAAMLEQQVRAEIIREVVAEIDNVRVETYTGLTVDFAMSLGASAILRGIRDSADLHAETQMALTNRVAAGIETVFVITSPEHAFTSASLIRQIASMGGDITGMVPPQVIPHINTLTSEAS